MARSRGYRADAEEVDAFSYLEFQPWPESACDVTGIPRRTIPDGKTGLSLLLGREEKYVSKITTGQQRGSRRAWVALYRLLLQIAPDVVARVEAVQTKQTREMIREARAEPVLPPPHPPGTVRRYRVVTAAR